ncbi:MAG: hypothetical protein KKA54_15215 [Proteobacteria bacterium]|nr:hypothetical protein [Pseudomonadota bacterium]
MIDHKRWHFEAQIGFHISYGSYLSAYRRAVDILFEAIEARNSPVNTISYPLLFLVRHSLEIGYKLNINYLSRYSGLDDKVNWDKHYLIELHQAFKDHFMAVVKELGVDQKVVDDFNSYYSKVEKLTRIFNVLDRGSYSFRYPVDTKQKEVFKHKDTINLLDVKDLYDKAMILLFHTPDVLSDATDYHDYMNEIMEQELRSAYDPY